MAEITPEQVHDLLTSTHEFLASAEAATKAREQLGHLFLDVARQARAGLRDLSVVTGLHHASIRAMIQRAIGTSGLPDGYEQLELPIYADLAAESVIQVQKRSSCTVPTSSQPSSVTVTRPTPAMSL
ncbi:MAG: hypothetical protein FWG47_01400 [Propionibacteriaceae bacterium]|nr:hypothetical protein [Propionibacteriaceae bacterium]